MAFPVDILKNVNDEALELAAEEYMSQLPYRNTEYLSLSDSKQIEIGLCNVSFVPLYGTDLQKKLLALFSPDGSNTVVGLYLLDRWWGVEDVLKTAEPSRTGLVTVSTLGERIVLYVLNRIVLRNEKSSGEVFFLCHCEDEAAKILWKDGEAIGFYSFKPKGSLCRNFVTHCYHLPVMDTVFVRKCHRGHGHGVKILEDFVGSFCNEFIGLKFPLSEAMYKVCEKYFSIYPADKELLWEVQNIGSPYQRTLIANRLQKLKLKEKDQVVSKLTFEEDDATAPMEIEITKVQETTEYTEIVEETIIDITKEVDDIPVTKRGKGSNLTRRGIRENSEERLTENIMRVEDIEAGVENSTEVAAVENLNTFLVKESETILRSSVDTTVTNFAELRGSQKEDEQEIEKDIVTATSEGTPITHLTTAGEIKSQRVSKEECEMVIKEYTVEMQGATIGSVDQSQLQSVVDVEIVKMSTGTEERKNKEVEEDEPVCEAEEEQIKEMLDEAKKEKAAETEVAEHSETHAKSTEKEQAYWEVEITENKERAEDEVMAESGKDLIEKNREDSIGQEKNEGNVEDAVLQQSEVKDQIEMEADSVTEVLSTEEVLCDQQKQNVAETEISEPNQSMTSKDTLIEKTSTNKSGPDEGEPVFTKSKLPQKRTSALTPSRRSKRLRYQPAEKDLKTTKSVKTVQQRSKHHSKAVIQDEDIEQSTREPEHDVSEVMEKIQEAQVENKAETESEVEEYKEKDILTVETVSTMDVEITQVEKTVDVVPEVFELDDQEEAPQQSSEEAPEVQEMKTTSEEDEETVENSTIMLTLSEAKVVLVDLHKLSPNEAGDNHGEICTPEQEGTKHTMSSEQHAAEETMRIEEQDGTLDTKPMEKTACTTTIEGYDEAADAKRSLERSTAYKEQEGEQDPESTEVVLLRMVGKPEEKTDTEQAHKDEQISEKLFPKQGKQTQKKGSIDTASRSTRLGDQPVDSDMTVRSLRSTLKPIKISPVRRSTRSKAVIQQCEPQVDSKLRTDKNPERGEVIAEGVGPEENEIANTNVDETTSVKCGSSELLKAAEVHDKEKEPQITKASEEPQVDSKLRTDENPERGEVIAEGVGPEENEIANTNVDETASVQCGNSELLKAAEVDDKEKEPQITKASEEIPSKEAEAEEDVTENRVEDIKTIENKEANLAGLIDSDIEMRSLSQEVHVQDKEVPVSTEIHLRRRTIRVPSPLRRKSRRVQKQKAEADEQLERHAVVSKNKAETIVLTTEERVEEMDKDVNKMENKEAHIAELEPVEEPNMGSNEYEKTSTTEETVDVCIPSITGTSLGSLDEMANTNIEETTVPESSELSMGVEINDIQVVGGPEEKVSLVEPGNEGEKDGGTLATQLQKATVVLVDLNKLSQNTEGEGETSEDLTHSQMEEKLELNEPDKTEQELSHLASEEEEQQEELQTHEDTEKSPEEEKMQEENSDEEQNKLDKQDMTFEEQKTTEDLATMPAEGGLVESSTIENSQNEDKGVSSLALENAVQENFEGSVSTQRSLRRRTIIVQSPPKRKSRRTQKQDAEVFEDKTETVLITEKEADKLGQCVEIDDEEKAHQTSTVDGTEKVSKPVEAEPEDDVADTGLEDGVNKMENKETNLAETKDKGEEASEVAEQTSLEQQQNEPLVKTNEETAETDRSMETDPVVGKEQTYIQTEEKVSQVSLVEIEPDEEVDKDDGTPVIQLQKSTVVLVDLNKLSQNTEGETDTLEVLTHSQTEEKLELDKPINSEHQLCNLAPEEKEQQEQLQKEEDTEKTPEEDTMEKENTVEEQKKANVEDVTFEGQKPTEDLEGQNDLKAKEIVEVCRAVIDEDLEEVVISGEDPKTTTTIGDKANIIQEAEKEKQADSDIEMSSVAQEAPEAVQEILEEEASVSMERSLRRRTIKIQSPPRRKSRRVHKSEAEGFEAKTRNIPITGKGVEEMHKEGVNVDNKEETLQKSTAEATEVIQLAEEEPEEDEKGFEDIMMVNKKTNLAVTKDTEEAPEMGEETNLEQQENEQLVENKETVETLENDPVVSKEQTTIQTEKFSEVESTETNQSDNERITRRSLRLSAKSVTPSQKTRQSTRLHKELEPVKETNMSRNEYEETSVTREETVNLCMPKITVESNLESLDETANTNVEETTAIEPETSELLMGVEMNDKEDASEIVEVPPIEAEPDEEVEKDDGTPVILQEDTLVLADLNKLSQNTEETDTPEVLTLCRSEEQLEPCESDKSEYELRNLTSEEEEQDMTVEGRIPIDDLVGQNDVKEREIVEEHKVVIDEDVEESVTSGEHPKATTMEDQTNITQKTEDDQDTSLKEKQMDCDVEMSSLSQEAPAAVQEILEEEASERSLRRRTIKIQSTPIRKSRRVQKLVANVFEDKSWTVPLTGKGDEEVHQEGGEIDKEETLQKSTVETAEKVVSLREGEPDEDVRQERFEVINNMENKETNLGNEATPEVEREEVNLERQENELFVENEKETTEIEKPMSMNEVSLADKEQTYVFEETTIQVEKEISQMESSEINENKSERTTRRSLRTSAQSGTTAQMIRKSTRLHKAELEPVEEAEMSRNEETSSMTAMSVNVCVPVTVETNVENLDEDRDMVSISKKVEATSDEREIDISNDKGKVDEALPERSTGDEEDETASSVKTSENEILVEMDKTQKDVEEAVQESQAEPSQENTNQEQEEAVSLDENVGETSLTNEYKTTSSALESSDQEAALFTRSLRFRTVTVQSTPRSKSKRPQRKELKSERKTDELNVPIGKENEALIAEESIAKYENLETTEGEAIIQTNTDGKSEKSGRNDNTEEEGNEILFEIIENNSSCQVNTEQNKTQENLEREDVEVPNEQEEEQVSNVQEEAKPLQESKNEGATEEVQASSVDLEETAVERRTLRKRTTVETAAPRKSKRLRKQEHDDDSEKVKETITGQNESAEVTCTADLVELRSDVTGADFEGSILGEEILQKIQTNAEGTKSDGDCKIHKDTETDAGESQEEQKQSRLNKTQTEVDNEEVVTDEIVIEQHVDLETSTNEGFMLALEVEETSDHEEIKADEESRVVMEASKEIFTSAEKSEKGEEGLPTEMHVLQSSSTTASVRRKSMRLLMHESKKKTKEDESDSESEAQQTEKQTHQRKRKAITDSTPAHGSKRHVRGRVV
ncbi:LOW QUALITY PROTEIN: trichohyalin-like [Labeo rohita]|uniref:LOW QUALITY PROTEIN: trichohyalin-like n=1 Tax=Labeo rohita TaxID=84645 RepID=UPI0021E33BC7|nr:LOW QUALITY PROTEIN: trichohyalin-like [Labeo rohita]